MEVSDNCSYILEFTYYTEGSPMTSSAVWSSMSCDSGFLNTYVTDLVLLEIVKLVSEILALPTLSHLTHHTTFHTPRACCPRQYALNHDLVRNLHGQGSHGRSTTSLSEKTASITKLRHTMSHYRRGLGYLCLFVPPLTILAIAALFVFTHGLFVLSRKLLTKSPI